jgi:mannan polymerase II complex MNN11 subunit
VSDYNEAVGDAPKSWAVVPAVRHAMATHPHSKYFFHLAANALIMNPTKSLKSHLLGKGRLEELMMKDVPIVPPDSIIKTFSHQTEKDVDLIVTQEKEDLNPGSFILKNGDFARFFLDIWFDPLYRNYNFAKAETHGLVSRLFYRSLYGGLSILILTGSILGSHHAVASNCPCPNCSGTTAYLGLLQ